MDGTPRPLGAAFDIGCYEFVPFPSHVELTTSSIGIYPNPTPGYVTISGELANFNILVLNVNGQVVLTMTGANAPVTIDLSQLDPGLHFLLVENVLHQAMWLQKIIKE